MEISDELYFATASPLNNEYDNTYFDENNVVDWFLVKPIVKKSKYGKKYTIGYTEAITNSRVCYSKLIFDSNSSKFILANFDSLNANVYWKVSNIPVNEILNKDTINNYLNHDAISMYDKINNARKSCNSVISKKIRRD